MNRAQDSKGWWMEEQLHTERIGAKQQSSAELPTPKELNLEKAMIRLAGVAKDDGTPPTDYRRGTRVARSSLPWSLGRLLPGLCVLQASCLETFSGMVAGQYARQAVHRNIVMKQLFVDIMTSSWALCVLPSVSFPLLYILLNASECPPE